MRLSAILVAVLLCAAGGQSLSASTTTVAFTAGENDNGREVTVDVGQELQVRLPCSLGTGYSWRLVGEPGPELSLVSDGIAGKDTDMPGVSQNQEFVFMAKMSGVKQLRFEYVRPWDTGTPPLRTYLVTTRVEG